MTGVPDHAPAPLPRGGLLAAVSILGPLAALLAVWLPVLAHFYVPTPAIDSALVSVLQKTPDDAVLARLDGLRYSGNSQDGSETGATADEILQGMYRTPTGETIPVGLGPESRGSETGSPMAQLQISSLAVAQVLLDAYRRTGQEQYFAAALRSAVEWARFERGAWLPHGFLWNDHAIAARVVVLTNLWREYRHRADFDPATGREILQFVARSAALLARDSHYTARTNHGIMQNLALLHVAAAFPGLPGIEDDRDLALSRLSLHLQYYVSPNGVVLEHSLGYQDLAIRLLRYALAYADILRLPQSTVLRERLGAAECFRHQLTRPDGSAPAIGDTSSPRPKVLDAAVSDGMACRAAGDSWVDQDFGYASLREGIGNGGHLLVTWANFAGRAHKHDDDLAAWLWLDGQDWWAGAGYWPYGDPDRKTAVSWRGANAPHAVGEPVGIAGENRLLGFRQDAAVPFLDIERRAADGRVYRRQVAGLGASGVLVLDSATGGNAGGVFETAWTLVPGVGVRAIDAAPRSYEVIDVTSGRSLRATFAGGDGLSIERLRGSRRPFGGLVAIEGKVRAAETLITTVPMGAWSAALWQPVTRDSSVSTAGWSIHWSDPERWSMAIPAGAGSMMLSREGQLLTSVGPAGAAEQLPLVGGATMRPMLDDATAVYREAAARYPVFRDYFDYRVRATLGIAALLACQLAGLWPLRRLGLSYRWCSAAVTVTWVTAVWWLYYQYLV